ncbi:hypothetical protein BCR43DRAFT_559751 [Syncephalastrum racemosum]|uniref:Uncharacterized protein n=1 Tax=Syncephalastrum racemosum TaxID=13706 RepID=A0A1X2HTM8_SYNRA|nr:hypothetical protein BCR43DRAFT_559751 [Syncephalastrum racemosum]
MQAPRPRYHGVGLASRTIEVPIQQDNELSVDCSDLPTEPSELLNIFQQEDVPYEYYRMLAVEYYSQKKFEQAVSVMHACLSNANRSTHITPRRKLPYLTLLATLRMRLYKLSKTESARKEHMTSLTQVLSDAEHIDNEDEDVLILKANLYLLRGKINDALSHFDKALKLRDNCIPALVGKGRIFSHLKQHEKALKFYQDAYQVSNGKIAATDIKISIALCLAQLGMVSDAKLALTKMAEDGTGGSTAFLLLAILEFNACNDDSQKLPIRNTSMEQALTYLHRAYYADPHDPVVLNLMANYFFLLDENEKAIACGERALTFATSGDIKSEIYYQLALSQHKEGKYAEALQNYRACVDKSPNNLHAQYGLGQMLLQKGDTEAAVKIFEELTKKEPNWIDAKKVLASLYVATGKQAQALECIGKVADKAADDPLFALDAGRLYEKREHSKALQWYEKCLDKCQELADENPLRIQCESIRPEIENNIAVLQQTMGALDTALDHLTYGIEAGKKRCEVAESEHDRELHSVMTYNLARLYEERREFDQAERLYEQLIKDQPSYIEPHLRLGVIKQSRGQAKEAIDLYKQVLKERPDKECKDVWILMGQAQQSLKDRECKRSWEHVLKHCDPNDIYTHIALGNFHSAVARDLRGDKSKEAQRDESLKLARRFYEQALRRDSSNVHAANGLAGILFEFELYEEAHRMLSMILEASTNNATVLVNLAHCKVELEQYREAIVMYKRASTKYFKGKDTEILCCLGRTQFVLAKANKDLDLMREALETMERALEVAPHNKAYTYNVALVQQYCAQLLSDAAGPDTKPSDLFRWGLDQLITSQKTWTALLALDPKEKVPFDRKVAVQREKFGKVLYKKMSQRVGLLQQDAPVDSHSVPQSLIEPPPPPPENAPSPEAGALENASSKRHAEEEALGKDDEAADKRIRIM